MQLFHAFLIFAGFLIACTYSFYAWVAYLAFTSDVNSCPPDDDPEDDEEGEPTWGPIVNSHWGRN
jgi:hypothetical protein